MTPELFQCLGVPLAVPLQLGKPKLLTALGQAPSHGAVVPMPEAAMDENDFAAADEGHVGTARQIAPVFPVAVAKAMGETPDLQLRNRILATDAGHPFASLGGRERIHYLNALASRRGSGHLGGYRPSQENHKWRVA